MKKLLYRVSCFVALALNGCGGDGGVGPGIELPPGTTVEIAGGSGQQVVAGTAAPTPLQVELLGPAGEPLPGILVRFTTTSVAAQLSPENAITNDAGIAQTTLTPSPIVGTQTVTATVETLAPVQFTVTVVPAPAAAMLPSGGDRQTGLQGQPFAAPLRVRINDAYGNAVSGVSVDWAVTQGSGTLSAPSSVSGTDGLASVTLTPSSAGTILVTASSAGLSGSPVTFQESVEMAVSLVATIPFTGYYHDQYIRDGIAFLSAWDNGLRIYDVGGGTLGGSPSNPKLIGSVVTAGGDVHNAWWYHAPDGQKRYVFVGQEGPGTVGVSSSGDIHVVDVGNMAAPVEVASYHVAGAGVHNFWVDEANEILYAAYYNGGVVALDISGTLSGDLAAREIDRFVPGSPSSGYVWGVMLYNGSLYASDMLRGFWQLRLVNGDFQVVSGGNNVPERFTSDLWIHGGYAYTGTWGSRMQPGNALKVWQLDANGAPTLVNTIITPGIGTVSDVEVSADGKLLMFSAENGSGSGLYFYDLTVSRSAPQLIGHYPAGGNSGVHTATFAEIAGRRYVVATRNSPLGAIFLDVTAIGP